MTWKLTPSRLRTGLEASVIVMALLLVAIVLFDVQAPRGDAQVDKARRFDRACTSITGSLKLARDRVRTVGTVEAGRDIAVAIAPVVGQCTGLGAHQGRLEGLATSNDAARDVEVIQGILDEIR